jgi:hypothetical protein
MAFPLLTASRADCAFITKMALLRPSRQQQSVSNNRNMLLIISANLTLSKNNKQQNMSEARSNGLPPSSSPNRVTPDQVTDASESAVASSALANPPLVSSSHLSDSPTRLSDGTAPEPAKRHHAPVKDHERNKKRSKTSVVLDDEDAAGRNIILPLDTLLSFLEENFSCKVCRTVFQAKNSLQLEVFGIACGLNFNCACGVSASLRPTTVPEATPKLDTKLRMSFHEHHTQRVEGFNKLLTKFLPKDKTHCQTIENKARMHLAVGLQSVGYQQWCERVFEITGMQLVEDDITALFFGSEDSDKLTRAEHCGKKAVKTQRMRGQFKKTREGLEKLKKDNEKHLSHGSNMMGPGGQPEAPRRQGVGGIADNAGSCKHCGSDAHFRITSKRCPQYPK